MLSLSLLILTIALFLVDAAYEDKTYSCSCRNSRLIQNKTVEISERYVLGKVLLAQLSPLASYIMFQDLSGISLTL